MGYDRQTGKQTTIDRAFFHVMVLQYFSCRDACIKLLLVHHQFTPVVVLAGGLVSVNDWHFRKH